jgi:excisionase family DNA binding protein
MMDEWYTTAEIAARLKVSEATVRAWLRSKRLRGHNFGGKMGYRVRGADLEAFLARTIEGGQEQEGNAAA